MNIIHINLYQFLRPNSSISPHSSYNHRNHKPNHKTHNYPNPIPIIIIMITPLTLNFQQILLLLRVLTSPLLLPLCSSLFSPVSLPKRSYKWFLQNSQYFYLSILPFGPLIWSFHLCPHLTSYNWLFCPYYL